MYEGDHAYFLQNPDGRIEFVIPYEQRFTLIGTTDIPFTDDPRDVRISAPEVEYLCESINRYFKKQLTPRDVVWSYAGVRPLYDDDATSAAAVTRDYELELSGGVNAPILLSVFGGKITTYRKLAEHAFEKLQPLLGGSEHSWTGDEPLPGGDIPVSRKPNEDFERFLSHTHSRWPFVPAETLRRLGRAYGTRAASILGNAKTLADLGEDFGGGLTRAEIDYLRDHEWANTADDILWRRSKLGLHVPHDTASKIDNYLRADAARRAESHASP
jgi:glycerol-3-phosphate dehydrogenase